MKRLLVMVSLALAEIGLLLLLSHSERMLEKRAVMFDPGQRDFYDLISSLTATAVVALPVTFGVTWKVLPQFSRFAASPLSVRFILAGGVGAVIYVLLWLLLNYPVAPAVGHLTPNKTLHTNRRPAHGFGLSAGLFDTCRRHQVVVRAAVGELGRYALNSSVPS